MHNSSSDGIMQSEASTANSGTKSHQWTCTSQARTTRRKAKIVCGLSSQPPMNSLKPPGSPGTEIYIRLATKYWQTSGRSNWPRFDITTTTPTYSWLPIATTALVRLKLWCLDRQQLLDEEGCVELKNLWQPTLPTVRDRHALTPSSFRIHDWIQPMYEYVHYQ